MPKFKAAVVQAAPVYLNLEASVDKTCALIQEAASQGAELVAFPEVFLPGYPYWIWTHPIASSGAFLQRYFLNSPAVPGEEVEKISRCIRAAGCHVVLGISERDNKSLYNTLLFFDASGKLIGKHRKLKATSAEKIIWADGDGGTLRVYSTALGKLSGLICGEHAMAIPGYILAAMGEEIHIAAWVGFSSCLGPERRQSFRDLNEAASKFHAMAYNTFVLNTQSLVDDYTLEVLDHPQTMDPGGGGSAIIAPGTGKIIAGPLIDQEGILYADIDLSEAVSSYFRRDPVGHGRSSVYSVLFDPKQAPPVVMVDNGSKTGAAKLGKAEADAGKELSEAVMPGSVPLGWREE